MQPSPSSMTAGEPSPPSLPNVTPELLEQAWFDAPPSTRRPSAPPAKAEETVGAFLGDELADAWLR